LVDGGDGPRRITRRVPRSWRQGAVAATALGRRDVIRCLQNTGILAAEPSRQHGRRNGVREDAQNKAGSTRTVWNSRAPPRAATCTRTFAGGEPSALGFWVRTMTPGYCAHHRGYAADKSSMRLRISRVLLATLTARGRHTHTPLAPPPPHAKRAVPIVRPHERPPDLPRVVSKDHSKRAGDNYSLPAKRLGGGSGAPGKLNVGSGGS